ncbi:MAG TPA: CBS domain-containing protein [Methanobacteriaceae archaeon]|nr:CBS domain-containing protein [Methanobacteriaceae archaeon]
MHVHDIMSKEVVVIDKDQNIHDALKLMKKHKISRLPVVNTNHNHQKELVGIITEKDIASHLGSSKYGNLAPSHFHVSTVMTATPVTIPSNRSIGIAAQIMLEHRIGGLPVVDDGEIVGMITKSDFMHTCQGRPFNEIKVEERMTTEIVTVAPQDRLVHARRIMMDDDLGRVIVTEGDEIHGILTAKDIALSMISFRKVVPDKYMSSRIRNLLVEDVMTQNVKTINKDATIDEATSMMLDNGFSGLLVMDDQMEGVITKTNVLELISELEEVH